ncbi:maleylpyruvate isomerase family mycothiol-dependent enzyme [Mycobacterium sp. PS03-16]|uniref:maleylpyruvate isomerase family mycothiol-dependent enzyme n=1 Tax=Mycobacterium sp. PS03-16 TaxID=2559611 RepID=UPI0010748B75|nr:maleylpyruvate isomerase family mycothiol-dependent enzyme [Mycobacterium sp. PS03-16]TFV54389.1 maleylpyruvate isomerase family mycothiol-dependent enzyme [Mycobacterium sp. PS03-16]
MDFRAALLEQTERFGDLIAAGDPATPVPTCGEWTLKQLFRHVGRGNRWAAQIVAERRSEPLDPRDVRDGRPPDDPAGAIEWLHDGVRLLLKSVDGVGSGTKVWTFLGPRAAGWWIRRRLHEMTVHRADAAMALGVPFDLPSDLAADALSEWIELIAVQAKPNDLPLQRGQTLHLHATDPTLGGVGEWTITSEEEGIDWTHEHGKGDVAVRGEAVDLLLAVTRRRTLGDGRLEVFGNTEVWDRWLERTPF